MKKMLIVSLVVCLGITLYAGCKEKAGEPSTPPSIYEVIFSDIDADGAPGPGDELVVVFDRHVTVGTSDVSSVFELSNADDDFGTSPSMARTSGHAVTITLGNEASLTLSNDDYVTSQIRICEDVPSGAIRSEAWSTDVVGGGTYTSIDGRMGYAAPRIESAVYEDVDDSGSLTEDDTITLTFTDTVDLSRACWPGRVFIVPVTGDNFGVRSWSTQTAVNEITIAIGADADFVCARTHAVGSYAVDKPSGIDVAITLEAGWLTYNVGTGDVSVPPGAADIE